MIILGAGISGLLAARSFAHYTPKILEIQDDLPNNHSALLRFRSDIVSKAVGIPFKKVQVYKGVLDEDGFSITNNANIRDYNAYSFKTTGMVTSRSIVNTNNSERFIAPSQFISTLARGTDISYGVSAKDHFHDRARASPILSTIPMLSLMTMLHYKDIPNFNVIPIWTVNCILDKVDVYQTLYVPYKELEPYRVSITGNIMTLEFMFEPKEDYIEQYIDLLFADHPVKYNNVIMRRQNYGKIVPISESERQRFILWATTQHHVYSLGRYAVWKQILLDDVMKDIEVINGFLNNGDYQRAMHYQERLV